ncbi:lysylphosphatidylglycerol synthase domain-containing protein [Roseateles sp. YR242]|uniref:lysylphosphatidylglycerol synthase domain-containing protein n=1 Tax=Roseateles sp. YR242 TaxID=1855305 RepID=UPI000AD7C4CA|nr:lysylphosphatidylglycerol synthase domain-containing protein [Roseateles sp. YR242]
MTAQRRHPWGRWLSLAFGLAVLALLTWAAGKVDWQAVLHSLRQVPLATLLLAALLCVASHLIYSCYDLLGKRWTGHAVPTRRVMLITFISYAFNLNLGSLVGAFAIRLRLYAHEGLRQPVPAQVLALSLGTNWLGYGLLAGGVFLMGWLAPPPQWPLGAAALKGLGGLMWGLVAGYLALCSFARRRTYTLRGHLFVLPTIRIAGLQLLVSSANWLTIGLIVHVLLQQAVPFGTTLAVLLVAAVAGVVAHVPAGLGVLEGVFVALLGSTLGDATVLAALIAYRALYYLAPLLMAATAYFVLEARSRR